MLNFMSNHKLFIQSGCTFTLLSIKKIYVLNLHCTRDNVTFQFILIYVFIHLCWTGNIFILTLYLNHFRYSSKNSPKSKIIQKYCLEKLGHTRSILQEYHKLTTLDAVVRSAQSTINTLCDHVRNMVETDKRAGHNLIPSPNRDLVQTGTYK